MSETREETPSRSAVRRQRPLLVAASATAVVLVGVVTGGLVFLNTSPAVRPPAVDLSPDQVVSAQDSVASARTMVDLLATTVDAGTSGIESVVDSIGPTFDSVDTAAAAAADIATAMRAAPNMSAAADRIGDLGASVGRGLARAQQLSGAASDVDELVGPLVDALHRSPIPDAQKTIAQLTALQKAAHGVADDLNDLGPLRADLDAITAATDTAAASVDSAMRVV